MRRGPVPSDQAEDERVRALVIVLVILLFVAAVYQAIALSDRDTGPDEVAAPAAEPRRP
jgi:hypothetical protein